MTNDQMRREFYEMAGLDGQDTARAFNGNIGDWVYLNPMTQDLYRYWQAATLKANQWRPIASAPKTGEWIIACDSTGNVRPDYWLGSEIHQWAKEPHVAVNTHWQPLPLPLTGTEQDKL